MEEFIISEAAGKRITNLTELIKQENPIAGENRGLLAEQLYQ